MISSIQTPSRLLVTEHMILVLTGYIRVVSVLVKDETPWMIKSTTLDVDTARGASVTIVAVNLIVVCAYDIQIPVVENHTAWLTLDGAELFEEGTSGTIIHKNAVGAFAGNIEVVIQSKGCSPRSIQTTRPWLHKHVEESASVSVVTKNTAGLEIRDVHGWEISEGEVASDRRARNVQLPVLCAGGMFWRAAAEMGSVDVSCSCLGDRASSCLESTLDSDSSQVVRFTRVCT